MSELQELIAKSSVNAFNSGYRQGKEDAIKILRNALETFDKPPVFNYYKALNDLIEEIAK